MLLIKSCYMPDRRPVTRQEKLDKILPFLDGRPDRQLVQDFFSNPEEFQPSRRAQLAAAGAILTRLRADRREAFKLMHDAESDPERQVYVEVFKKIRDLERRIHAKIFERLPRKSAWIYGFKDREGDLYMVDRTLHDVTALAGIDNILRQTGLGLVETLKQYISYETQVSMRREKSPWRANLVLVIEYTANLPYKKCRDYELVECGARYTMQESTFTNEIVMSSFTLSDWVVKRS